jgi:hypothetical protein
LNLFTVYLKTRSVTQNKQWQTAGRVEKKGSSCRNSGFRFALRDRGVSQKFSFINVIVGEIQNGKVSKRKKKLYALPSFSVKQMYGKVEELPKSPSVSVLFATAVVIGW